MKSTRIDILLFSILLSFFFSCDQEDPFVNSDPEIISTSINKSKVSYNNTVQLKVTASDENTDQTLSYSWTAVGGELGSVSKASTEWVSGNTKGVFPISVTVSDGIGTAVTELGEVTVVGKFFEKFNGANSYWSVSSKTTGYDFEKGYIELNPKVSGERLGLHGKVKKMVDSEEVKLPLSLHAKFGIESTLIETDRTDLMVLFEEPEALGENDFYLNSVRIYIYPNKEEISNFVFRYSVRAKDSEQFYEYYNFTGQVLLPNELTLSNYNFNDYGIEISEDFDISFYFNQKILLSIEKFNLAGVIIPSQVSHLSLYSASRLLVDEVIVDNTIQGIYDYME